MCLSCKPKKIWNSMVNRRTKIPIAFNNNQLNQLRRNFLQIAKDQSYISKASFKQNMGMLGLRTAQLFSDRLFASFDLDDDNVINFDDFVEYMDILKNGKESDKAHVSFRMIDIRKAKVFTKKDFKGFMNDFLRSWSAITNVQISSEIMARTDDYVQGLFTDVPIKRSKQQQVDFDYYYKHIYKDNQFISAFDFITQGVANFFISKTTQKQQVFSSQIIKITDSLTKIYNKLYPTDIDFSDIAEECKPHEVPVFRKAQFPILFSDKRDSEKTGRIFMELDEESNLDTRFQEENEDSAAHRLAEVKKDMVELVKELTALKEKIQEEKKFADKSLPNMISQKQKTVGNVHKRLKKTPGKMVFFGDTNWNLVLNMMVGIQMAVRSVKGFQEMIYQEPQDFKLKYYFELVPRRFGGEDNFGKICKFTDYAPNTFNHIRRIFNIDNEDYIKSIGPDKLLASLLMGEMSSLSELTSQGKSGSFFYYTADGLYMLKTIHQREYALLREILQDYYHHLVKNPNSLITKFFGLHELTQRSQKGKTIRTHYFVIMANVFHTQQKITQRYDLKGSEYGRVTSDTDEKAAKKDLNFMRRNPIVLEQSDRQSLLNIIHNDCRFFAQHNIIDYSLLLGMSRKGSNKSSSISSSGHIQTKNPCHIYDSQDKSQRYLVGIIDILTLFDTRKKMEYCFKRMFHGDKISAIPPGHYAERFEQFMRKSVFR